MRSAMARFGAEPHSWNDADLEDLVGDLAVPGVSLGVEALEHVRAGRRRRAGSGRSLASAREARKAGSAWR